MALGTALAIASLATTAVGTGISYYNQRQQAKTAEAVGDYNAQMAQATANANADQIEQTANYNADQILKTAQFNAERTLQITDYNARSIEMAADYNTMLAENKALLADMTGRETIRRIRSEGKKTAATQTARYAKAGVMTDTGTPLEVMADTAGMIELNVLDRKRQAEAEAQAYRTEGAVQRWMSYKEAEATRYFGKQDAWAARNFAEEEAAATRYFGSLEAYNTRFYGANTANATRLESRSRAAGIRGESTATLISGAGRLAGQGYDYFG